MQIGKYSRVQQTRWRRWKPQKGRCLFYRRLFSNKFARNWTANFPRTLVLIKYSTFIQYERLLPVVVRLVYKIDEINSQALLLSLEVANNSLVYNSG